MLFILAMTFSVDTAMKLLLKLTFFTGILCFALYSRAQVSYRSFHEQIDLNVKSEMGLELWNYYLRFDLDSLKIAAVDLLLVASEEEHEFARAVGTRMLGSYLYRSGKIEQGLGYLNIARDYFEKREDFMVASEVYNEIGHSYFLQGKFGEAKHAYEKSIRLGEQSTDATAAFNGKLGLGKAYIALGDTNVGMTLIHSYKQLSLQNQKYEAASDAFAYLAQIESALKHPGLSNEYYIRSVDYSRRSRSKVHIANSYTNLAILKFGLEQFDSSLYFFKESLRLREEMSSIRPIIESYYNLGFFYAERDSIDKAIMCYEKSVELARKHKHYQDEMDALTELVKIYKSRNMLEEAETMELRIKELDSLSRLKKYQEDVELQKLDLDFEGKKSKKKSEGGIGWITFTIIVVSLVLLFFLFLERRKFN